MKFVVGLAIGLIIALALWIVVTWALVRAEARTSTSATQRMAGRLLATGVALLMADSVLPMARVTPIHNGAPFDVVLGDWAFLVALLPTLLVLLWATARPGGWLSALGVVVAVALLPLVVVGTFAMAAAEEATEAPQATNTAILPELGLLITTLASAVVLVGSILWGRR